MKQSLLLALATLVGAGLIRAATLTPAAVGEPAVSAAIAGRSNLALASGGATAFSSSDLGPNYSAPDVNNGVIDHSGFSWIPATANVNEFVGVRFSAANTVGAVVWHGQTGYNGRSGGTYSLEYSKDANPGAGSTWTAIGTYTYVEANCATPMPRTYFAFTPISGVTGIRLVLTAIGCGIQPAVQELEAYAPLSLTPGATGDAPVAGAIAGRPNLALASAGGVAFSSSDLGPNYSSPDVTDGIIDHTGFSWIPTTAAGGDFVGVGFAVPADIDGVVWHGQTGYNGRSGGNYSLEYTTDASPGAGSAWTALGEYTYTEAGCLTPMPRSFFSFSVISNVTGVRLVITTAACGIQPAIQELEAYGPLVSAPTITSQPAGGTFDEGSSLTLSVLANGGTSFQWRKDGVNISGATSASYIISNVRTNDAGSYTVVAANSAGSVTSDAAVVAVTPAPTFATYAEAVLADQPLHYYPFDEPSGTTLTDQGSGPVANGTLSGGVTLGQPSLNTRLGKAAQFDGQPGTFIDLGLFHAGDAITVEVWANLDPSAVHSPSYHSIVARWDGSYEIDFAPGDVPNFVVKNDANTFSGVAGTQSAARDAWHHFVGIFANGELTMFVDGVQGSVNNPGGVLQDAGPEPDRVLIGGTRSGTAASFNFQGLIDEVAIYDRALTAAQVRNHFRTAFPSEVPPVEIALKAEISWPNQPPGLVLQETDSLQEPVQWKNVTIDNNFLISRGGTFRYYVPVTEKAKFFRLLKP